MYLFSEEKNITLSFKLLLHVVMHKNYQAYQETWLHDQKSEGK